MQVSGILKWNARLLFSFLVVAVLGVVMRYKIGFELPIIDQKKMQHAHSHFAFAGWIGQALLFFIIRMFIEGCSLAEKKFYQSLLLLNFLLAIGMLISFAIQGYGFVSITFSTASLLFSFYYIIHLFRLDKLKKGTGASWIKLALVWNGLSSLGTMWLVFMMITKNIEQNNYLYSIYWYLHFQYNGWFFFAAAGTLIWFLSDHYGLSSPPRTALHLFAWSCFPAYGLSVLWSELPPLLYLLVVLAALMQLYAWVVFLKHYGKAIVSHQNMPHIYKVMLLFLAVAVSVKFLLQTFSVVPFISQMAFGFRPVVIAYLHLVLLSIFSVYCTFRIVTDPHVKISTGLVKGVWGFLVAILLNQVILGIHGVSSLAYFLIPGINTLLLVAAVLLFFVILYLAIEIKRMTSNSA